MRLFQKVLSLGVVAFAPSDDWMGDHFGGKATPWIDWFNVIAWVFMWAYIAVAWGCLAYFVYLLAIWA